MEAFVTHYTHYGYIVLFLGVLLEGEAVLVAAGALAHRGDLSLPIVILTAFGSSVVGDQAWFHVGRRFGTAFVQRRPRLSARLDVVTRFIARYGMWFVVGFRF